MDNQPSLLILLQRLWKFITPMRRKQFSLLLILMIFASFAEIISIGAVLPFLAVLSMPDKVFSNQFMQPLIHTLNFTEPTQLILPITILFAIAALVSGAIRMVLLWAQTRLSHAVGADISFSIYHSTLHQSYAVHMKRNSSEVISSISRKVDSVVYFTILPVITIFISGFMLLAILVTLVVFEPIITLTAFTGFGSIYVLVTLFTKNRVAQDSLLISHESTQAIKALQEGLGGIRDLLINGTQSVFCNFYNKSNLKLRHAQANVQIISGMPRFGLEAIAMVLVSVLAYSVSGDAKNFGNAIPMLGAIAMGGQRLLPMLQQVYLNWSSLRSGQSSLSDVLDFLEQPMPSIVDRSSITPLPFQHSIKLKKLSFRYDPQAPLVLKELDLTIPKSSHIGFIGHTGSGKSTLLDIIMGLLEPTTGSLSIDGVTITEQNQYNWQCHIAHVPQAIYLADASVSENIAFGIPSDQIDHTRIHQAAQKAMLAETIDSWENKYQTMVGENGVRLSGGQRQRIGIARALYKKANVIIFDEATSALDNDTESAVMDAISNLSDDLTILIIAHRLTTLKNCSQIVELEGGIIKRIGSYAEMVNSNVENLLSSPY